MNPTASDSRPLRRGLTLIEVLIVLVLLGVTVGLVMVAVGRTDNVRAREATNKIATDLEYAQSEAQRRQASMTVSFDTGAEQYTLSDADGTISIAISGEPYMVDLRTEFQADGLDVVSVDFGGSSSVTYTPVGEPTQDEAGNVPISSNSAIVVQYGDYSYTLRVAPVTGNITVTTNE